MQGGKENLRTLGAGPFSSQRWQSDCHEPTAVRASPALKAAGGVGVARKLAGLAARAGRRRATTGVLPRGTAGAVWRAICTAQRTVVRAQILARCACHARPTIRLDAV